MDVSLSLKHNKRKKQTLTLTQACDFDVEYSVINHDLIVHDHKHEERASEGISLKTISIMLTF